MKVKDLIEELKKVDSDYDVVVERIDESGDSSAYDTETVDFGWSASGIVSIVVGDCIME